MPPVEFEPATPWFWGYETPAQYDVQRKLSKKPLKHVQRLCQFSFLWFTTLNDCGKCEAILIQTLLSLFWKVVLYGALDSIDAEFLVPGFVWC